MLLEDQAQQNGTEYCDKGCVESTREAAATALGEWSGLSRSPTRDDAGRKWKGEGRAMPRPIPSQRYPGTYMTPEQQVKVGRAFCSSSRSRWAGGQRFPAMYMTPELQIKMGRAQRPSGRSKPAGGQRCPVMCMTPEQQIKMGRAQRPSGRSKPAGRQRCPAMCMTPELQIRVGHA
eukprot:1158873-Pelagomonas_calceolata.AAC.5